MPTKHKWRVTKGSATAVVFAIDYATACERAAQIGFRNPDSVVRIDG